MTAVVGSNFYSETWNTLYELISGNITDPASRNKKFVFGAFPDIEGKNFPGFPLVIINPIISDTSNSTMGYGQNENTLSTTVTIWSKRGDQLDVLSDDVRDAISSNKNVLVGSGLTALSIGGGTRDTDFIGDNKAHYKELDVLVKVIT